MGEDSFPFLKDAIEKAKTAHNVLIVADGRMGAWLFTCILRRHLGEPQGVEHRREVDGYEIHTMPEEEARISPNRALGCIFVISRAAAKKLIGKGPWFNISDVFVWTPKETRRMSVLDWQEQVGLKKKRPLRYERKVL